MCCALQRATDPLRRPDKVEGPQYEQAWDLVQKLLAPLEHRWSAAQALGHPWLQPVAGNPPAQQDPPNPLQTPEEVQQELAKLGG